VVTLPELIRQMAEGRPAGRRSPSGARDSPGGVRPLRRQPPDPGIHEPGPDGQLNEYCSRTCCSATLQAAVRIRESYRTPMCLSTIGTSALTARGQEEYYERASKANVIFFRYEPRHRRWWNGPAGKDFPLRIRVNDTLTFGEELSAGGRPGGALR